MLQWWALSSKRRRCRQDGDTAATPAAAPRSCPARRCSTGAAWTTSHQRRFARRLRLSPRPTRAPGSVGRIDHRVPDDFECALRRSRRDGSRALLARHVSCHEADPQRSVLRHSTPGSARTASPRSARTSAQDLRSHVLRSSRGCGGAHSPGNMSLSRPPHASCSTGIQSRWLRCAFALLPGRQLFEP
jgi:hypothetical protein